MSQQPSLQDPYVSSANAATFPPYPTRLEHTFVSIRWGTLTLHMLELNSMDDFWLDSRDIALEGPSYLLPAAAIGADSWQLLAHADGTHHLLLPEGAQANILENAATQAWPCVGSRSLPQPALGAKSGRIALEPGMRVEVGIGAFSVLIERALAEKKSERAGLFYDPSLLAFQLLSLASFASVLLAMSYFVPPLGLEADEDVNHEQMYLIRQYLAASAERAEAQDEADTGGLGEPGSRQESTKPVEASVVRSENSVKQTPFARTATKDDAPTSRAEQIAQARTFGMVELMNTLGAEPSAAWQAAISADDKAGSLATMWGNDLTELAGNGTTLSGSGLPGGGPGGGINLDGIRGLSGPGGPGGTSGEFGRHLGRPGAPAYKPKGMSVRTPGNTSVSGHLPAEVIQRTVRQNYGRFRLCYEQGLLRNPSLAGRITVRFVIGRDGAVLNAQSGGSDLPDAQVSTCLVQQFYGISFPAPDSGIVRVSYPLLLSPGD